MMTPLATGKLSTGAGTGDGNGDGTGDRRRYWYTTRHC
jgi:hypothetical protein